jgi:MinD-like ATPase involved in chromosome partitioning or flagellar assembly
MRHLERLAADEVWIDLGAGTAYNVVDFFVAAQRGLLVVAPEPTSVENTYSFLKTAFFRSLRPLTKQPEVRAALDAVLGQRTGDRLRSPSEIISEVARLDAQAGRILAERAQTFRPALILNGVHSDEEYGLGRQISVACRRFLGIEVDLLGTLPWEPAVGRAVRARRPVVEIDPSCAFSQEIEAIADRLVATAPAHQVAPTKELGAPAPEGATPGPYLRAWRQRLGLSLDQAIAHTRIRLLDAIENEAYDALPPEETYLRGLVLNYARALGTPRPEAVAIKYLERYRYAQHRAEAPPVRVAG